MQEWQGFTCLDAGDIKGRAAMSLADHIDLIEYFRGHVSEGIEDRGRSSLHTWEGVRLAVRGLRSSADSSAVPAAHEPHAHQVSRRVPIDEDGQIEHTADEGLDQLRKHGHPGLSLPFNLSGWA